MKLPEFQELIRNAHILLVDDEPQNIMLLGKILQKEAYSFAIAENGTSAFKSIQQKMPDLILLDIMMPGINGIELCRELKKQPDTALIPIIFLTAKIDPEDKVRAFEIGAADYITKPYHPSEVIARVRLHLREKFSRDIINTYNEKLEEMLELRTRELLKSERQAALGVVTQGIVHNMKTPLSVIAYTLEYTSMFRNHVTGFIEKCGLKVDGEFTKLWHIGEELLQKGKMSYEKLSRMIENLMIKSKNDKRNEMEVVDLNEVLRQEVGFYDSNISFKHHIKKEVSLHDDPLPVEIVVADISQVISNLIGNALDALNHHPEPVIRIESGHTDHAAWFTILDNGPGIPEILQQRVFDPFFTTKNEEEKEKGILGGTGLGLHYCRQTLHTYGGAIRLTSEEGKGACFHIQLPLARGLE